MTGALTARISGGQVVFGDRPVLAGLDLDLRDGEFVAVVAPPGAGKTTLVRILLGLTRLDDGHLLVPPRRTAVFPEPGLNDSARVLDNVLPGRRVSLARRRAALEALSEVGLASAAWVRTSTLCAEDVVRVALARALVREPDLLLLDEPFAAFDTPSRTALQSLLARLCRRHGPAVLLATNDLEEALRLADRIVVLKDGRVSLDLRVDRAETWPVAFEALHDQLRSELGAPIAA